MLLIHPPVAKPCEPPAGIARLSGLLHRHGIRHRILDASLEGLLNLLGQPLEASDRWTARAVRNRERNLEALRSREGYALFDRYHRAVSDLNRALEAASDIARVSLGNFQHAALSPLRSADCLRAAETPEANPFYPYFSARLPRVLAEESADTVGFSLNFLHQALTTFAMIGFLRRVAPRLRIVVGGGLVTSWVRRPGWKDPFGGLVDHLVAGPGEAPLLDLLGRSAGPEASSAPSYAGFPLADYLAPGPILPFSASSGCYWSRCAFCPERAEGNPYLPTPPARVLEELRASVEAMHPALIHLLDNALSPSLMQALIASPPGAPWYGFARITAHLADEDFCLALKRSGCAMLKLGLESGDQRVLDAEGKGMDLEVASKALKALHAAGIPTYVYLLFGTPSETADGARRTLEFAAAHHRQIQFLNLAIFNMPVYGPEAGEVERRAHYDGDLTLYTGFVHPKGWHRAQVRQFLDREFKRHPAIQPILRRDPPFFTSNHAPFFGRQALDATTPIRTTGMRRSC